MQATFGEVLETIEGFSIDEKETLIDILQNRLRDYKRERIIRDVEESRMEYEAGNLKPRTVDEIMNGALS